MHAFFDAAATALLTYGIHSAAACALALVASRFLRRPQDRDLLWKATLVAPLISATLVIAGSAAGVGNPFVDLAELVRHTPNVELPGREVKIRLLHNGAGSNVVREFSDPVTTVLSVAAIAVALFMAGLSIIRLAHRRQALRRAVSGRRVVGELPRGFGSAVQLSAATQLQTPVALGGGEICLPAEVVDDFSERHRESLIAHEVAHLERRDPAWFFMAELIAALSAFQPLIFVVLRAFRRDVELICDETAVRRTSDQQSLIGALALLASPFDPRSPLHGAATAYDGSPLVARAQRIATLSLTNAAPTTRRPALVVALALFVVLCAVPVVSAAPRLSDIPLYPPAIMRGVRGPHRIMTVDRTLIRRGSRRVVILQ
jgi:beta-lactamase regulating signal transducer with metallopeptidase domain